ncbi:MAG: hypothetical protein R3362_06860, partial [Rhodothermales bacterium]|nr:hypothetical protein [Rhodothermales bacterium]
RSERALLLAAAVAYVPLAFLGYGADVDAYAVLEAADRIGEGEPYAPSRPPGFPVHELAVVLLGGLGGSVLSNLGTAAMVLVALGSFLALGRRFDVPHRLLLGAVFAFHPFVWANAAATIDYFWALGFALAGAVLLLDRRWAAAGLLFGLAIGARATSLLLVACLLGFVVWRGRAAWRGPAVAAALAVGLGALCYVPTLVAFDFTLGFLTPVGAEEQAAWSWAERLGRFGYKNVYLWGLPAALALVALLANAAASGLPGRRVHRALLGLCGAVVVLYEALYLRYPLEQEYLIPTIPFVLLALGVLASRRGLVGLGVLVLAYNAVSLNVARPDRPLHATGAEVGLWVEPGYLVADVRERLRVRDCRTIACWTERWEAARD